MNLDELPDGYQPSPDEPYMNPRQLAYFRKKLLDWRQALLDEWQRTVSQSQTESENLGDEADRAAWESQHTFELRTRDRYQRLLAEIGAALKRIDDGSYGYCEDTGEPIGLQRLEARPIASLTVEAQERRERANAQYGQ